MARRQTTNTDDDIAALPGSVTYRLTVADVHAMMHWWLEQHHPEELVGGRRIGRVLVTGAERYLVLGPWEETP